MVEIVRLPVKPQEPDKMVICCPDCGGVLFRVHTDSTLECQSCAGDHALADLLALAHDA